MSNQGPSIIHYEVYALDEQRWILQARFRREEKEDAMEEAKMVENTLGLCAKVVRETYYPGNNACEETMVYSSDRNFQPRRRVPAHRQRAMTRDEIEAASPSVGVIRRSTAASGSMGVFLKLLVVVATSLGIASAVSAILTNFLSTLLKNSGSASLLGFLAFIVTFLATAVPLAMSAMDWREGMAKPSAKPTPSPVLDKPKAPPPPEEPAPATEPKAEKSAAEEPPKAEQPPPAEEPPKTEEPPGEEKQEAEKAEEGGSEQASALEVLRLTMIRFLSSLLGEVKKGRPALDAYNKFGVDLMLAGAVDVLGNHNTLDAAAKRSILKQAIEVMGTKGETAQAFSDKYEDYLVETKYLSMVQAGRNGMEALLAGADISEEQVSKVFDGWNKPQQTLQSAPRIVTVLFTDMVGSTDLTQVHGDQAAQDMVRRHNSIVRTALADCSGKEIKHTGDGIMASFTSAANGVEAAIAIQRACADYNEKYADQPLHLRIGLNAGEPIEEEDDLFGTTVQLSARVCAQSGTNEILCTNVVRELSAGKGLTFVPRGPHELKGFKDPVDLYEVLWAPPSATDPAPPAGKADGVDASAAEAAAGPAATAAKTTDAKTAAATPDGTAPAPAARAKAAKPKGTASAAKAKAPVGG